MTKKRNIYLVSLLLFTAFLLSSCGQEVAPQLTPVLNKIVFTSYRDGDGEIYLMETYGSNQRKLSDNPADDLFPDRSP